MAAFLLAMAGPLAARVLVSIGVGILTYEGVVLVAGQIQTQVVNLWGQLPLAFTQLAALSGLSTAFGIIIGGILARASIYAAVRLGLLPGISP
ncbi:DUF2523 family protein [Accumulibacter sp.]|uniref:DUF2523 family protein n=1 Tax=Accumulibacter sp. TaxID=2053492 RepID=UPI001ACF65B2|nr:DUF2523 family protein [Accumulibacter sp.]MBN8454825.1 DUF2523 domain-containing protein [Accumulibacter sp.]